MLEAMDNASVAAGVGAGGTPDCWRGFKLGWALATERMRRQGDKRGRRCKRVEKGEEEGLGSTV